MAHNYGHGKLSEKKIKSFPQVFLDKDNDFASIRLAAGTEAKSYIKDGFVFSEDSKGKVIEIQILNLRLLAEKFGRIASPSKAYNPGSTVGERIRNLRKAAGLSISSLAEKAGLSRGSLGSIENNERAVGLSVLKRIAKALKADIAALID